MFALALRALVTSAGSSSFTFFTLHVFFISVGDRSPQCHDRERNIDHELQVKSAGWHIRINGFWFLGKRFFISLPVAAGFSFVSTGVVGLAPGPRGRFFPIGPLAIVRLPFFCIAEYIVSFGDDFKFIFSGLASRVGVRVVFLRQLTVFFFDIGFIGFLGNTENLVIISSGGLGHGGRFLNLSNERYIYGCFILSI